MKKENNFMYFIEIKFKNIFKMLKMLVSFNFIRIVGLSYFPCISRILITNIGERIQFDIPDIPSGLYND